MAALQMIPFDEKARWDGLVKSFADYDVYYLWEYVSAFRHAGDGTPFLMDYRGARMRLCYPVFKSDIAKSRAFSGLLEKGRCYDLATPYGYGGPLAERASAHEMAHFFALLKDYCNQNGIVSQFIRFHPLLGNAALFAGHGDLRCAKRTVFVDLTDRAAIFANLEARCRGAIKKAQQSGVQICIDNSESAQKAFARLYSETMRRRGATAYYFFSNEFFDDFFRSMAGFYNLFCAFSAGEIISAAIILHGNKRMHYHLSGSDGVSRQFSPNSLLLYTAACWGADNGYEKFHLGGGVEADDSLFLFKKSFNKKGQLNFYIGRNIFSSESFDALVRLRADADPGFNPDNSYLIQYRA